MWFEKQNNGNYKFRESYIDPLTGRKKTVSANNIKNTKKIREEMLLVLQGKIDAAINNNIVNKKITFEQLTELWFEVYKETVKASTSRNVSSRIAVMNKHLGDILMDQMTPAIINSYLLHRIKQANNKYRVVSGDKSIILRIMSFGFKYGHAKHAPYSELVEILKINMSQKNHYKYLEKHELKIVFEQLEGLSLYEVKRLCQLQVSTGLRYNELVSIDYSKDIDFETNHISINKTYDHHNGVFTTPKSGNSRVININEETATILKKQIEYSRLKMVKHNLERNNYTLFVQSNGKPIHIRVTNRYLKQLDIPGKIITTHIFRHTFITTMVENRIEKELIAKHVGHSSIKMIDEVYSHFTESMADDLEAVINSVKII